MVICKQDQSEKGNLTEIKVTSSNDEKHVAAFVNKKLELNAYIQLVFKKCRTTT